MKTMRIAPTFRYQLRDFLLGFAPFYGCIVLVAALGLIFIDRLGGKATFAGFGAAAMICAFVFGVVTPRPNLRLNIQLGVSRRTAFVAQLLALVVSVLALAVAGELLVAVGQAVAPANRLLMGDLYQMIYLGEDVAMSLGQHMMSGLFNVSLMLMAFAGGMFFTCLFWRLNKLWTVVVAIAIPVLLNLLPIGFVSLTAAVPSIGRAFVAVLEFFAASVWRVMGGFVLAAVVLVLISWLLVRRANIRAPQGK